MIQIGSIIRIHNVSFKYFNGARQLTGALYSDPKKGHGVSILHSIRKMKDLTGIPLYYEHDDSGNSNNNSKARRELFMEATESGEGTGARQYLRYPVATKKTDNEGECENDTGTGADNEGEGENDTGTGAEGEGDGETEAGNNDCEVITIDKKGRYYYYDPDEWCIVNNNKTQTNAFTTSDKKCLLQYSLWSQALFMNHMNLHDCISQQEGIAGTLYEAFKWEFVKYEGLNNTHNGNNTNNGNTNQQPYLTTKIPKYDCICMVGYVLNATSTGASNKQTCLYVYDGTGSVQMIVFRSYYNIYAKV